MAIFQQLERQFSLTSKTFGIENFLRTPQQPSQAKRYQQYLRNEGHFQICSQGRKPK